MFSKETITPARLMGKETRKKGLPNFKKLEEFKFKKQLGMDASLDEVGEEVIPLADLAKFNAGHG
jgi:hypothetical protein